MNINRYKRLVALVELDGKMINEEMVAEGWAWAYRDYLNREYASEFIDLEERARKQHHDYGNNQILSHLGNFVNSKSKNAKSKNIGKFVIKGEDYAYDY